MAIGSVRQKQGCLKVTYLNRKEAESLLREQRVHMAPKFKRNNMHAYRCKACGLWHVGRNSRK